MSEDLTDYLLELRHPGALIPASEVDTLRRIELLA